MREAHGFKKAGEDECLLIFMLFDLVVNDRQQFWDFLNLVYNNDLFVLISFDQINEVFWILRVLPKFRGNQEIDPECIIKNIL